MKDKFIWIAILVFLFLVFLAVGVSTDFTFRFGNIYEFIKAFFVQWSYALSASGTVIVAIGIYITWYRSRKEREEAIRNECLNQISEWAYLELEMIYEGNRPIALTEGVKDPWRFVVYGKVKADIASYSKEVINDKKLSGLMDEVHNISGSRRNERLTDVIVRVNELKMQGLRKEVKSRNARTVEVRWWHWFEFYTRFFVWIFGLLLASIAVIDIVKTLPENTGMSLMIALIVFLVAALITWYFDVSRLFPPKRVS